jgi:hypothetical protein
MTDSTASVVQYLKAPSAPSQDLPEEYQEILQRVNQRVAASESLESLVDFLFEQTGNICPCDRVAIAFVTEDGIRIVSHYVRTSYEPVRLGKGYSEDLQDTSLAEVIGSGSCRIIRDLEAYLEAKPLSRASRLLVDEGVRSSMTCPLYVDDRVVGVLFRSSRRKDQYDRKQVAAHYAVAERLSQAVEKVHRIEQLAAANRAYTEMLGFVSHELKSPVSSMITDATVLEGGYVGDLTEKQKQILQRMTRKGNYLLAMVREYLDLARIESGQMDIRPRKDVDFLSEVMEPALEIVAPQIEEKNVRLHRDVQGAVSPIECDAELLKVVLINYLSNAVKYGKADDGRVDLVCRRDEEGLHVAVRNEGRGFGPADRKQLFRKFSRLSVPEFKDRKGTGVGLYAVRQIVSLHGGKVDARSEKGAWAQFSFQIPQPLPAQDNQHGS